MAEVKAGRGKLGRTTGSSASRRLRVFPGRIPGVVYGHGMEPLSVSVVARDLGAGGAPPHTASTRSSETRSSRARRTWFLARQLQRHPVRRTVGPMSIFQVVSRDEVVHAVVPIVVVGVGRQRRAGKAASLEQLLTSLQHLQPRPSASPKRSSSTLSALEVGQALRVPRPPRSPRASRTGPGPRRARRDRKLCQGPAGGRFGGRGSRGA